MLDGAGDVAHATHVAFLRLMRGRVEHITIFTPSPASDWILGSSDLSGGMPVMVLLGQGRSLHPEGGDSFVFRSLYDMDFRAANGGCLRCDRFEGGPGGAHEALRGHEAHHERDRALWMYRIQTRLWKENRPDEYVHA